MTSFDVPFLISAISGHDPPAGRRHLTGTPEGVGTVEHGDVIDVEVEDRVLRNP